MLRATNIEKSYGALQVLKGISLEVAQGEIVSLTGASGAGKSTLLHILGTLDKPDKGEVFLHDKNIFKQGEKQLATFRNSALGFVFQFHHLLPEFTALENVCMPAFIAGKDKKETQERAKELLALLNVAHRLQHKPAELSGGEQQRVAVARAFINKPSVILADEPSGNLDTANAQSLHELFFDLRKAFNQTFIIVTHNQELAQMADRCIHLKDGQIDHTYIRS
ncbi:MAG: ABC transporter ATP-binding protein [Chitinophagales bacterium]|nr:ABC transporter ATP-binding protein [Chitinophagales bacterium]